MEMAMMLSAMEGWAPKREMRRFKAKLPFAFRHVLYGKFLPEYRANQVATYKAMGGDEPPPPQRTVTPRCTLL